MAMLYVARWWTPVENGFAFAYPASHWVLSYEDGLIRRGLIGAIVKLWIPLVKIENVYHIAFTAYGTFLVLLLTTFYALLKSKDKEGRLFRVVLVFSATPATLSLLGRDLGRFDLFLIVILFLCLILLSIDRHTWMIPILMVTAMFIHESFLVLYTPMMLAAMIFMFVWGRRGKKMLGMVVVSAIAVVGAFLILYNFGNPTLEYEEFSRSIQSRAGFTITELSMRECYFSIKDHYTLASSSLFNPGSIANLFAALIILSPAILILLNLWSHAFKNCGPQKRMCQLLFLSTLSGLMVIPIATDYGRWLSAVVFCNFFAIFFLVSRDVIKAEELVEYSGRGRLLLAFISVVYLVFGPLHDWEPFPYQDNIIISALSIIAVLLFDIGFYRQWRSLGRATKAIV